MHYWDAKQQLQATYPRAAGKKLPSQNQLKYWKFVSDFMKSYAGKPKEERLEGFALAARAYHAKLVEEAEAAMLAEREVP